jgi:hypothetical protein
MYVVCCWVLLELWFGSNFPHFLKLLRYCVDVFPEFGVILDAGRKWQEYALAQYSQRNKLPRSININSAGVLVSL